MNRHRREEEGMKMKKKDCGMKPMKMSSGGKVDGDSKLDSLLTSDKCITHMNTMGSEGGSHGLKIKKTYKMPHLAMGGVGKERKGQY